MTYVLSPSPFPTSVGQYQPLRQGGLVEEVEEEEQEGTS